MNIIKLLPLFLALVFSFSYQGLGAQTPIDEAVRKADIAPAWPGCDPKINDCTKSRLGEFINANLQIPPEAKAEGAGGVVMMEFVVEKNGNIGEIKPIHDPGLGLGAEATRVINLMKSKKIKWVPAENDGKKIPYRYTVPVSFNLSSPNPSTPKTTEPVKVPAGGVYEVAEVMPRYTGCEMATKDSVDCTFSKVLTHIKTNLKYPEEAIKNKVHGQVVTEFVVDTNGTITNAAIKKGIGSGCDEEALRVLMLMPPWIPGSQDGHPVKVKMILPFVFQLPKE